MKKYCRTIKKSFFSNLFFKHDFKFSKPRKFHFSFRIKFAFHNNLFLKNFPLFYLKEKTHGSSKFPLKLNVFYLKSLKPANEKNRSLNLEPGKNVSQNLICRFKNPGFSSLKFNYSEQVTYKFASFNLAPIRLIDRELTAYNLQPTNIRSLNPNASEFGFHNNSSASSSYLYLNFLKPKFFENNSRFLISKIGNRIQILQKVENSFLKLSSHFFTRSRLPVVRKISFQEFGFFTSSSGYPFIPLLTARSLFRNIYNETLRKNEELKYSGRDIFGREVLTIRTSTVSTYPKDFEILMELLSRFFNRKRLKRKPKAKETMSELSQRRQHSGLEQSKREIWEKQRLTETKSEQKPIKTEEKHYNHEFNWLTTLKQRTLAVSQLNRQVTPTTIRPACRAINSDKIRSFSYVLRHLKTSKLTSEYTHMIRIPTAGYHVSDPHIEYAVDYYLSDPYAAYHYTSHNQKAGNKRELKRKKQDLANINKLHITFNRHLLLKSLFPDFHIQQPISKLITLFRSSLLAGSNVNLNTRVFSPRSSSTSGDHKSKKTMDYKRSISYKTYETSFLKWFINVSQQYPQAVSNVKAEIYENFFAPSIEEQTKEQNREQTKNLQFVPKLNFFLNLDSKISESTITRIFNCLVTLAHSMPIEFQQKLQTFQIKRQKITSSIVTVFQLSLQEVNKLENQLITHNFHSKIKPASRILLPFFNIRRILLTGNRPTHTNGIHTSDSPANISQEKKSHSQYAWLQKTFKFSESLLSYNISLFEGETPAYTQKTPVLRENSSVANYTLKRSIIRLPDFTKALKFDNYAALKFNLIKEYALDYLTFHSTGFRNIYSYHQQAFRALNYVRTCKFIEINRSLEDQLSPSKVIRTANNPKEDSHVFDHHKIAYDIPNNKKMEKIRDRKREKQYSVQTVQINKLQNKFIHPLFLKSLNIIVCRLKKKEILLCNSTQNLESTDSSTRIFDLKEIYTDPQQNHKIHISSVFTGTQPAVRVLNYPTSCTQSNPAFFTSFSSLHKKDIFEYLNILYSPSGMGTPVATEFLLTEFLLALIKKQNPIQRGTFSSNGFLSGRFSNASPVPLLPGKDSTATGKKNTLLFSLLKFASSVISQSPVFARKPDFPSNTGIVNSNAEVLRYIPASISYLNEEQKLNGQKVQHPKTSRMNLSLGYKKRGYANAGNFLLRSSLNSLKIENNNQQVNKNVDIPAKSQMRWGLFSGSVLSSRNHFIMEMSWKKIFSTTFKQEKKPGNMYNILKGFLLRFKILKNSEETARSDIYTGPNSTYFALTRARGTGKTSGIAAFRTFGKERSELMHAVESIHKQGRGDLVYGTSQTLLEEVKRIEKIVFETKEAVADHFESHLPQANGKFGQVMDVEKMSDEIMQMINHKLKIEAERRGIF
jgi:hypothetical protein